MGLRDQITTSSTPASTTKETQRYKTAWGGLNHFSVLHILLAKIIVDFHPRHSSGRLGKDTDIYTAETSLLFWEYWMFVGRK